MKRSPFLSRTVLSLALVPVSWLPSQLQAQSIQYTTSYPRFVIGVTGISATILKNKVVVRHLAPGSPADSSGLVSGDCLTYVGDLHVGVSGEEDHDAAFLASPPLSTLAAPSNDAINRSTSKANS